MNKKSAVIILGTAHLGTTPGKCSPDLRLREAEYSRQRVEYIKASLQGYGYTVFVDYEDMLPNTYIKSSTPKEEQMKELNYRVKKVNGLCEAYGKENCLYVSVHVDAAGNGNGWSTAGGWSAWTTRGETQSDKLAECLYDAAVSNLGEYAQRMFKGKTLGWYGEKQEPIRMDKSDGDRDKEENFFVLKNTRCIAVLTENMFQDNKADVEWLMSDAGKHAIERLHVEGIMKYIKENP